MAFRMPRRKFGVARRFSRRGVSCRERLRVRVRGVLVALALLWCSSAAAQTPTPDPAPVPAPPPPAEPSAPPPASPTVATPASPAPAGVDQSETREHRRRGRTIVRPLHPPPRSANLREQARSEEARPHRGAEIGPARSERFLADATNGGGGLFGDAWFLLALLAVGGGLLLALAAVSGRLQRSLPLEITADRGEVVILGSAVPGRCSRGRLDPTSPAVTVQRLQLLALAVALGLLGGQPAAADPPILTKPTVSGPPSWTQASSAQITFTSPDTGVTFMCRVNGPNWSACTSPVDYTGLSEGPHAFSVEAVAGSEPSTPSEWSWTVDQTPPSLPGDVIVQAASPLGTVVTLAAHDNLDPSPTLSCTPSSATAFPLGNTALSCTAQDAAGNSSSPGSVSVEVVDTTAPVLAPHANVLAAQESASGASVAYGLPTASDAGDPTPGVTCSPASGSTFPLGTTQVTCSATDGSGNHSAQLVFDVVVQQGSSPPSPTLTSTLPAATKRTDATFAFDVAGGAALACKLDRPPGAGTFAPCSSPQELHAARGRQLPLYRARDQRDRKRQRSESRLGCGHEPAAQRAGAPHELRRGLDAALVAETSEVDFERVVISRRRARHIALEQIATSRRSTTLRDSNVRNDMRYVYALRSIDRVGNRSAAGKIEGRASRILGPGYDTVRGAPPLIDWAGSAGATFFNMQLWYQGRKVPQRLAREVLVSSASRLDLRGQALFALVAQLSRLRLARVRSEGASRATGLFSAGRRLACAETTSACVFRTRGGATKVPG